MKRFRRFIVEHSIIDQLRSVCDVVHTPMETWFLLSDGTRLRAKNTSQTHAAVARSIGTTLVGLMQAHIVRYAGVVLSRGIECNTTITDIQANIIHDDFIDHDLIIDVTNENGLVKKWKTFHDGRHTADGIQHFINGVVNGTLTENVRAIFFEGTTTDASDLPPAIQGTLFAKGLNRERMRQNADRMSAALDATYAGNPYWTTNVRHVQQALDGMPFIHTTSPQTAGTMWRKGILPSHTLTQNPPMRGVLLTNFAFDRISGLDRMVFLRQGQPGGHGSIGVLVDPAALDPDTLVITKLGLMTLKQDEDAFLRTPGDHRTLVDQQLDAYRDTTISYSEMGRVQARLLMDGYLRHHPQEVGQMLDPETVIAFNHGEMEVKYADSIPQRAILGFLVGTHGTAMDDTLAAGVPPARIFAYAGGPEDMGRAYRQFLHGISLNESRNAIYAGIGYHTTSTLNESLTLYHTSNDVFPNGKPTFPAYFGDKGFLKSFPHEFGSHTYAISVPASVNILYLDMNTRTSRHFKNAMARIAYPNDPATKTLYLDGSDDENFYELWTDKNFIIKALDLPEFRDFDAVNYQSEYLFTIRGLAKVTGHQMERRLRTFGEFITEATQADFNALGDAQRGTPESAMLDVQHLMGGGVMNPAVEHIGDLTHRMTEKVTWRSAGYEYVKDKVTKTLRWLTNPYGFEREFEENITNNAAYYKRPVAEYRTAIYKALNNYADAHAALSVYNDAQRHARDAAVALGRREFNSVIANLQALQRHLGSVDEWVAYAHEGVSE